MRHAHTSQISVPSLWSEDLHEFPLPLCDSIPYLSIWDVVIVWDAKKSTVASHFISVVWILLSKSAVSVYDSQEYKNIDMTSERINLILQLSVTFPPFQIHLGIQFLPSRLLFAQLYRDFLVLILRLRPLIQGIWSCWRSRVSRLSAFDAIGVVGHPLGFHLHTVTFSGGSRNFKTKGRGPHWSPHRNIVSSWWCPAVPWNLASSLFFDCSLEKRKFILPCLRYWLFRCGLSVLFKMLTRMGGSKSQLSSYTILYDMQNFELFCVGQHCIIQVKWPMITILGQLFIIFINSCYYYF